MEQHLRIFFAIVNLVIGTGSFVYINNLKKKDNSHILKYLKYYIVFFNLIILTYFLIKYLNVNLINISAKEDSFFRDGFLMISSIYFTIMI